MNASKFLPFGCLNHIIISVMIEELYYVKASQNIFILIKYPFLFTFYYLDYSLWQLFIVYTIIS